MLTMGFSLGFKYKNKPRVLAWKKLDIWLKYNDNWKYKNTT